MAEVFDVSSSAGDALDPAEAALARGGIVVLPTDTVYGVAGRPDVPGATDRLFVAKRRPRDLTLPVLVASSSDAGAVAVFDERARVLAERYWPGALTMVLPRADRARGWELGDERTTVGVRVPAHDAALALLRRTGPLAVTSANVSGEPTAPDCDGVLAALGDAVDVYLCAGTLSGGVASTVLDLSGSEAKVLREGALPPGELLAAIA